MKEPIICLLSKIILKECKDFHRGYLGVATIQPWRFAKPAQRYCSGVPSKASRTQSFGRCVSSGAWKRSAGILHKNVITGAFATCSMIGCFFKAWKKGYVNVIVGHSLFLFAVHLDCVQFARKIFCLTHIVGKTCSFADRLPFAFVSQESIFVHIKHSAKLGLEHTRLTIWKFIN